MSRPERIAEQIKKVVSAIIREDVNDPRIGFVSITKVELTSDLENAKIFISILGDENQKVESMKGLQSATSFVRGKLGDEIEFRSVPEIRFVRDDSLEKGSQVLNIMSKFNRDNNERNSQRD
ncbi:MAG: 30S ribosome-binding factor RbfA [bacterium]